MCGRITQEQLALERQFRKQLLELLQPKKQYNIGIGEMALVVDQTGTWKHVAFGFAKGGRFHFNGRAEGYHNKENALHYTGALGLDTNPVYADLFTRSRCLIPVSSFLEGPEQERLSKPFKISLKHQEAFMLAGIIGTDEKTGKQGFSIVTCWPNQTIQRVVGHHRCPVILPDPHRQVQWLHPQTHTQTLLNLLKPIGDEELVIEAISPQYKSAKFAEPY